MAGKIKRIRFAANAAVIAAICGAGSAANAQISAENWGMVTAPSYGTSETGIYAGAELFAGPNKFGAYYAGVLPNGRIVKPAGISVQIGMNPLGAVLTPDGKFLITSDDDERDGTLNSVLDGAISGGYGISVLDTQTMKIVSRIADSPVFIGLQVTASADGGYTLWASGGASNKILLYALDAGGTIKADRSIALTPITPSNEGYVSNYKPTDEYRAAEKGATIAAPPVPSGFNRPAPAKPNPAKAAADGDPAPAKPSRKAGSRANSATGTAGGDAITFPAGSALSPDGRTFYVACDGDNSVAIIDVASKSVLARVLVGYFPYGVAVSASGKVLVSNWGVTDYRFRSAFYKAEGPLTSALAAPNNQPDGFYVPKTDAAGKSPRSSSISITRVGGGSTNQWVPGGAIYMGKPLDALKQVGDTHPSALAIVRKGDLEVLYVAKSNEDSLGMVRLDTEKKLADFDLSPVKIVLKDGQRIKGAYPNALAVSPDGTRLYVAEAGINSVAALDTSDPLNPKLLGRIPTGWYPSAVTVSPDGKTLYIVNAKGVGEDVNPNTDLLQASHPTGLVSFADSNFIFGTVQKVNLADIAPSNGAVLALNFAQHKEEAYGPVPLGGKPSAKIKRVFFILHENKAFDSMLGNLGDHFGPFASMTFNDAAGKAAPNLQFTGVSLNTQQIASAFATAVNYYSDSEESDAGHQFCESGTATDYTEKTLLVKEGRGLLVNKNMEPEDYPANGYLFNNAARHGVSFKDYGDLIRIEGTDTGSSLPTKINDPASGKLGYPVVDADTKHISAPLVNVGDTDSTTSGLGQSYFMALPALAILGTNNRSGEPRLDRNYPGYNFNISDQRRAKEFIKDFDRMEKSNTLPQFVVIYQPNDHTGKVQAPNASADFTSPLQQVADGDVALGMALEHIMKSPAYYDRKTDTGSAIFVTWDDAQSSLDHIHPHRTPLVVVSPFAKPGYLGKRHYVSASIVKTEELLLGLPPNNYGDLFATDLRDLFQNEYNGITADKIPFTRTIAYKESPEGRRVWSLAAELDTSAPDRDSLRLGELIRLTAQADALHNEAEKANRLSAPDYKTAQEQLYNKATQIIRQAKTNKDGDD